MHTCLPAAESCRMGSAILPRHDDSPLACDPFQPSPRGTTRFYRVLSGAAMVKRRVEFPCRADWSRNDLLPDYERYEIVGMAKLGGQNSEIAPPEIKAPARSARPEGAPPCGVPQDRGRLDVEPVREGRGQSNGKVLPRSIESDTEVVEKAGSSPEGLISTLEVEGDDCNPAQKPVA